MEPMLREIKKVNTICEYLLHRDISAEPCAEGILAWTKDTFVLFRNKDIDVLYKFITVSAPIKPFLGENHLADA